MRRFNKKDVTLFRIKLVPKRYCKFCCSNYNDNEMDVICIEMRAAHANFYPLE